MVSTASRMACLHSCRVWLMSVITQESHLFQALALWFPCPQATVLPDASPGPHPVVQHGVALPGWVPWIWKGAQSFSELAFPYILWPSHLLRAQTQVCDVGRAGKKGSKETTEARPFTLTHWLRTWLVHLETLLLLWVVLFFFCFLSMTEHIWIFWGTELRLKTWNTVCCYLF